MKLGTLKFRGDLSGITYVYADRIAGTDIELKTKDFYGYLTGLTHAYDVRISHIDIKFGRGTPLSSDQTGFIRAYAD